MKVLFLDIDGVLNSASWLRHCSSANQYFDPTAIKRLNQIFELVFKELPSIVISSSWRYMYSTSELRELLRHAGFTYSHCVIDKTDTLSLDRGHEIQLWVAQHQEVESIVVLDDCDNMPGVKHRLVQTDYEIGLTDEDVARVVKLFESPAS